MLRGETVTLELEDGTTREVENVLVAQSDLSDQSVLDVQTKFINQARYKGDQDTLTLEWPKAEPASLVSAHVTVRGDRYRVYGNPMPYADAICPTDWNRQVTAVRSLYLYKVTFYKNEATQDEWGVTHSEYVGTDLMCNLLRKTDDVASGASSTANEAILMFELPLEDWDPDYVALRYPVDGGEFVRVTGLNYGTDTIVVSAQGGVSD
jgi:hypothetical protein